MASRPTDAPTEFGEAHACHRRPHGATPCKTPGNHSGPV